MGTVGRALGSGTLRRVNRGGQALWVLDFKDSTGRRTRRSLSPDRRVAERMRAELVQRRDLELAGLGTVEGQSMPLAALRDLYVADLEQRAGHSQVHNVRLRLKHLLAAIRATRVRDVKVLELLQFRAARLKAGISNRTANTDIDALKAMLNWAVGAQLIAENPIRGLKRLPTGEQHQTHRRRALSDAEIDRFLAAAEADDADCAARLTAQRTIKVHGRGGSYATKRRQRRVPQAPLWRSLLETGARYGELTRTTWADLDVGRRALTLRAETTKSGRSRVIPLRAGLVEELVALRAVHLRVRQRLVRPGDRIFATPDGADWGEDTTNLRRIFERVLDDAGIEKVDAAGRVIDVHALRHTAASRMARRGVPLVVTQRVLGHASPDMTSRHYTHLGVEDLRGAVELDGDGGGRKALGRSA